MARGTLPPSHGDAPAGALKVDAGNSGANAVIVRLPLPLATQELVTSNGTTYNILKGTKQCD